MKIALRNVLKHKWTSVLMIIIFILISAALYLTTGISNSVKRIEYHMYRDSMGDATIYLWGSYWGFYQGEDIKKALETNKAEKIIPERIAWGCDIDNANFSGKANVFELTPENRSRSKDWFYLSSGRLPKAPGEAAIPEARYRNIIKTGDEIYLSTYTPKGRIYNSLPFKVVGVLKMEPIKAGFDSILITKEDMDDLLNTTDTYNSVTVYNNFPEEGFGNHDLETSLKSFVWNLYIDLNRNGIGTDDRPYYFDIVDFFQKNRSFVTIFQGINILAALFIFPIAGAVIAITIRMLAIKRTAEFATYMAIGFRNFKIIRNFVMEIIILALSGYILGISIGAAAGSILEAMRVYLVFQDYMNGPFMLTHSFMDFIYILIFVILLSSVWSIPVINRIISKAPARVLREQSY